MNMNDRFVCYFHFIDWTHISLGLHVSLDQPNIELHVPFGFFRIGMQAPIYRIRARTFGIGA